MREDLDMPETALVTGASSGIGEALASCFAAAGMALVLVARRADKLEALARQLRAEHDVKVTVLGADLSQPNAPAALAQQLKRRRIAVDILVNNAGVLVQGSFVDMPSAEHRSMIDLNIAGLTAMLTEFVPPMKKRGYGRILNVASIAAFQPVPSLATYAATKAYVLSLSESLSEELRDTGVTVTALCPGITATPMLNQAADANDRLTRLPGVLVSDVQAVAAEGFAACMRGDAVLVPGVLNRAAMVAGRAIPKWLLRRIAGVVTRQIQ
jgi:short-subunit dehydrogenase